MNAYLVEKLKEGRVAAGLKQSDVAKITGVKPSTLSGYENGIIEPSIDTLFTLYRLYSLDIFSILEETYGFESPFDNYYIKLSDLELIKGYRRLDSHGKELVDMVIKKECERLDKSNNIGG